MILDLLQLLLPLVVSPFTLVASNGVAQFDDIFTLILLFGCFMAFCFGWLIGLLSIQV